MTAPYSIGDRWGDCRVVVRGVAKPPTLSRRTLRALCVASLAVIVYGTLGPLMRGSGPWVVAVEHWRWAPPRVSSDFNDVVTNFAVYVPVGVAFRLLVRRRGRAGWPDLLLGLGLSVALSYTTEVLQQAMPGRMSSLTDVYVNGLAALTGCLCAVPVQRVLRRLHAFVFVQVRVPQRRWAILACAAVVATAILMTMPWSLMRPRAELGFGQPLSAADVQRGGMFALVGLFIARAVLTRKQDRSTALAGAWLLGTLVAVGLELSQLVLHEHVCSLLHAVVSVGGVSAGCAAAAALVRPHATPRAGPRHLRALAVVALIATAIYAGAAGLGEKGVRNLLCTAPSGPFRQKVPDTFFPTLRSEPAVDWVPFHAHFHAPFPAVIADVLEQLAAYSFLTLLCLFLARERGPAVSCLLLFGLVGASECVRALVAGHHADTTAPLLAIVAWLLTTRVWRSIQPRRAVPDRVTE